MTVVYEFTQHARKEQGFSAEITLTNAGGEAVELGCLRFSLARILEPQDVTGALRLSRDGDLHTLTFDRTLAPGATLRCQLNNPRDRMVKFTDWPYGVYAETPQGALLSLDVRQPDIHWQIPPYEADSVINKAVQPAVETLVPQPTELTVLSERFDCPSVVCWGGAVDLLALSADDLATWAGLLVEFAGVSVRPDADWSVRFVAQAGLHDGYRLTLSAQGATLEASQRAGALAGLASLVQWLGGGQVCAAVIEDQPRFAYRGLHLDVVRHFVSLGQVCKVLRLAAVYKFNQFHWHLTDDEAWRLEIKAYPELTAHTAVRGRGRIMPPQMGTGAEDHGGFYTQEDVRAVVKLAGELGINVMPEIDVPGHARALLRALPELQEAEDQSVYRSVQHYSDNVLNPALPATWRVLYTVLDEVMQLFPSVDIHLGSDEVPKGVWQHSPAAQAKARVLGLQDVTALHGWMMRELENYLQRHGRRAAGWEEITVDHAVSRQTTVFSWQGVEAGQRAAQLGYPVVMTPAQYCYLDLSYNTDQAEPGYYWAGETDIAKAYGYEPLSGWGDGDVAVAQQRVRGMQACLWSELLAEPEHIEYMLLPRLLAVAERAWSAPEVTDVADFVRRCRQHTALWQRAGWCYRAEQLGW